jgi:hypothetical protein
MTVALSIIYHPKTDIVNINHVYKQLMAWHPVSVRKYETKEEAISTIRRYFDFENSLFLKVGDMFLEKIENVDEDNLPDIVFTKGPKDEMPDKLSDFLHFAIYSEVDEFYFEDIIKLFHVPVLKSPSKSNCYELKVEYDSTREWMWFEVQRPYDEPPFTTVVKNYPTRGMEPLFAQLFISKGWGLLKDDIDFLEALWKEEFPDREFDLHQILENHGKELTPSKGKLPLEPPWLFRKPIQEIKNHVEKPIE